MPNVKFFFRHKLTGADFKRKLAWFERRKPSETPSVLLDHRPDEIEVEFDLMIGADGAHSSVRYHLMKFTRMKYQQEYIDTLWCEFTIPSSPTGGFQLHPNRLHIWPGESFMFIAIANRDGSFSSTLFLSEAGFKGLDQTPDNLVPFFRRNFPGVVPDLISEDDLKRQYYTNPHLPLISIKCTPYHYASSCVILGDAAHAMVPFYGQGMNSGLEDVRVLFEFLDKHSSEDRAKALEEYSIHRTPDAAAINDLALHNYEELRSDVRSPIYKLRKWVEEKLDAYVPSLGWATQYSRVSFGNQRYSEVDKLARRQGNILAVSMVVGMLTPIAGWAAWWYWRWSRASGTSKGAVTLLTRILDRVERFGRQYT
jgi:kynurenine 3-monooxygenase